MILVKYEEIFTEEEVKSIEFANDKACVDWLIDNMHFYRIIDIDRR